MKDTGENPTARPLVSVVCVHYRETEELAGALASLRRETRSCELEILIVDNEGNEAARRRMLAAEPEARWFSAPDNPGFAAAVNLGLSEARGEWILLLNPDVRVEDRALDRCVQFAAEGNRAVDVVGCTHIDHDGSFQRSSFPRATWPGPGAALANLPLTGAWLRRFAPDHLHAKEAAWQRDLHASTHATDAVQGSFLLLRRSAALRIGGFDPDFFLYCEELDFCRRLRATGGQIFFLAEAHIRHGGEARRQDRSRRRQAALSENLFVRKAVSTPAYFLWLLLRLQGCSLALLAWPFLSRDQRARANAMLRDWQPFRLRHWTLPLRYRRTPGSSASPLRT